MTSLVACLSSGKGTWAHVAELIKQQDWDSIFLVTNEFGQQNFKLGTQTQSDSSPKPVEFILINDKRFLKDLTEDIRKQLENKIHDTEVALNFISGSGKEHMAVISALLKLGLGIRLVALTKEGIKEI